MADAQSMIPTAASILKRAVPKHRPKIADVIAA
jgi:hypothetical protein